jgi:hypothetical protein
VSATWDAPRAIATLPIEPFEGVVWRGHRRRYEALSHGGSLVLSGRYHQAVDLFPADQTWPAFYTALGLHVALGEVVRNIEQRDLEGFRFTEIRVALQAVLDCRDLSALGLTSADLLDDTDYAVPRALSAAAIARNVEAIIVPSASLLGDNLIVFSDRLWSGSTMTVEHSIDPRLIKDRAVP